MIPTIIVGETKEYIFVNVDLLPAEGESLCFKVTFYFLFTDGKKIAIAAKIENLLQCEKNRKWK